MILVKLFGLLCPRALLLLRMVYGVSWLYLSGCVLHVHNSTFVLTRHKVGYETYKAYRQDPNAEEAAYLSEPSRLALSVTQRAFQLIASM